MPIPGSRADLCASVQTTFEKLQVELDAAGPRAGSLVCVDDWTVKDLLAVRAWWTRSVIDWVEAGRRHERPALPAEGYRWSETPRLNSDVIERCRRESFRSVRGRLEQEYSRVLPTIDALDDHELLDAGVFDWAGRYPIARWISINTTRQYTTARTYLRKALKERRC